MEATKEATPEINTGIEDRSAGPVCASRATRAAGSAGCRAASVAVGVASFHATRRRLADTGRRGIFLVLLRVPPPAPVAGNAVVTVGDG